MRVSLVLLSVIVYFVCEIQQKKLLHNALCSPGFSDIFGMRESVEERND